MYSRRQFGSGEISASSIQHGCSGDVPRFAQNTFQLTIYFSDQLDMPLRCPFCNAEEDERVSAIDREGRRLVLVMFNCPFSYRFPEDQAGTDESLQVRLNEWRKLEGDAWLGTLGPIIRDREMRGIQRYQETLQSN